ncbi:MAG: DUF4116 domain-containing protein [Candidatus Liptonbacteria bacterium]|nr:DUF4116 domain-containing protein [Candidatus Liptonbacteria bacterium]
MEKFNPSESQYKTTGDLPESERGKYKDVDGGFVTKEAKEGAQVAELAVLARNQMERERGIDLQHVEAGQYDVIRKQILADINNVRTGKYREVMAFSRYFGKDLKTEKFHALHDFISGDKELLLAAGKWLPRKAMQSANEAFRGDKDFVLKILKNAEGDAPEVLFYASEQLRDDPEVVKEAIKQNACALAFASDRLKEDLDTVLFAAKIWPVIMGPGNAYTAPEGDEESGVRISYPFISPKIRARVDKLIGRVEGAEGADSGKGAAT